MGHARKLRFSYCVTFGGAPPPPNARISSVPSTWRRYVRPQDFVWLLFFSALAVFGPGRSPRTIAALVALGFVQVLEPRIGTRISVVLQLALCYFVDRLHLRRFQQFLPGPVPPCNHRRDQLRITRHRYNLARSVRRLSFVPRLLRRERVRPPKTKSPNWSCEFSSSP